MDSKMCTECKEVKNLNEFYSYNKKRTNGDEYIYYHPYCKPCAIEKSKAKTKDEIIHKRELNKELYNNKKDKRLAQMKVYREDNYEEWSKYYSAYQNREYVKENFKIYRFNRMNKEHDISKDEWNACKDYFNYECAYCGLHINDHYNKFKGRIILTDLHQEHVDHNGANDLSNCVPSCKSCNSSKRTSRVEDWYNEENENYSKEKFNKITQWLNEDYKRYIKAESISQ